MKNKNRLISLIIIIGLLMSMFGAVTSSAAMNDTQYQKLVEQRKEYIDKEYTDFFDGRLWSEFYFYWPLISPDLTVLLYTDVGKELTLSKNTEIDEPWSIDHSLFIYGPYHSLLIYSPEIYKATEPCRTEPYGIRESVSGLRECIQYFDITKEELKAAFKKMKEDPDYIRPLLNFLTDEEFESGRRDDGTFGNTDWPEFIIEAMFIEDDAKAHRLITEPYAVYVPEVGRIVEEHELYYEFFYETTAPDYYVTFEKLKSYDLTTDAMGEFIEYQQRRIKFFDPLYAKGIADLAAEREKQLANPKTGEAVYLIPVAVLSLAVGVFAIYPRRKRKFDNI